MKNTLIILLLTLLATSAHAETAERVIVDSNENEIVTNFDEHYSTDNLSEDELQFIEESIREQVALTIITTEGDLAGVMPNLSYDDGHRAARRQAERQMRQAYRQSNSARRQAESQMRQNYRQNESSRRQAERQLKQAYRQSARARR